MSRSEGRARTRSGVVTGRGHTEEHAYRAAERHRPPAEVADDVEAGNDPVALARPGHLPVVLVSAEEWHRLDELESEESTAWWHRDTAERAAAGEPPDDEEEGQACAPPVMSWPPDVYALLPWASGRVAAQSVR